MVHSKHLCLWNKTHLLSHVYSLMQCSSCNCVSFYQSFLYLWNVPDFRQKWPSLYFCLSVCFPCLMRHLNHFELGTYYFRRNFALGKHIMFYGKLNSSHLCPTCTWNGCGSVHIPVCSHEMTLSCWITVLGQCASCSLSDQAAYFLLEWHSFVSNQLHLDQFEF